MTIIHTTFPPSALIKFFTAIFISLLPFISASATDSGTVQFQGKIVEDVCYTRETSSAPQVSCYRDGQWRSQPVLMKTGVLGTLPYNTGTTRFSWINKNKNMAMVTYNYH